MSFMQNCVQAVGKLHTLWIAFAKFYERHGDIENARVIFDKATQVQRPPKQIESCDASARSMLQAFSPYVYSLVCWAFCL